MSAENYWNHLFLLAKKKHLYEVIFFARCHVTDTGYLYTGRLFQVHNQ